MFRRLVPAIACTFCVLVVAQAANKVKPSPSAVPAPLQTEVTVKAATQLPTPVPQNSIPKMIGEFIPALDMKDLEGKEVNLKSLLAGHHTALFFAGEKPGRLDKATPNSVPADEIEQLSRFLARLNYQMVAVYASAPPALTFRGMEVARRTRILIDPDRSAFAAFGLWAERASSEGMRDGLFIVDPDGMIKFSYVAASDVVPLSGEVVVLAARVYRDLYIKKSGKKN